MKNPIMSPIMEEDSNQSLESEFLVKLVLTFSVSCAHEKTNKVTKK